MDIGTGIAIAGAFLAAGWMKNEGIAIFACVITLAAMSVMILQAGAQL